MKLNNLTDLYLVELKDLYSAETQLIRALPKMAKAATSPSLREAFEEHLSATEQHRDRLEQIFKELDASPKGKKCVAMEGLIEEGSEVIEAEAEPAVKDAALIAAAQRVEHYEIAVYGTARSFAELLGHSEQAELLQTTLDEEEETDEALSELAESEINEKAMHGAEA
jgi:ferritin-like metal-binding protein YciE